MEGFGQISDRLEPFDRVMRSHPDRIFVPDKTEVALNGAFTPFVIFSLRPFARQIGKLANRLIAAAKV